ncbi:MAG: GNAT family N-acetyltransferase [Candidatus Edwardsbacteria bacterium]|nr:GNAT family N-acetyltransferase [Candidatus Edwardsbacteria bacterium]
MFELETARLRIIALDYEHFKMHLENNGDLQRRLHLSVTQEKVEDWFAEVMQKPLLLAEQDQNNQYWYSNWQIVRKDKNSVIGGICFKGPANSFGKVEIGYGIEEQHQRQGYATEAIQAVVKWAMRQDGINAVIAETDKDNIPSQSVLEKNGFVKTGEGDELIFWEK